MKLPLILAAVFLLSGCNVLFPQPKQAILQDQQNFALAFDAFRSTRRVDKLQQFRLDFPDSVWAVRAETLIRNTQELEECKVQAEKLGSVEQQQIQEKQRLEAAGAELEDENQKLKDENRQLSETIEQLKGLLIEMEQHPQ